MGARESRARNPEDAEGQAGPPDYYALLEVEETATADELRVREFIKFSDQLYAELYMS